MPYITQEYREEVDKYVEDIVNRIKTFPINQRYGIVNYIISRITASSLQPTEGWGYSTLSRAIAILIDAAAEMRRRLLDKYEDSIIIKNGDLDEYKRG